MEKEKKIFEKENRKREMLRKSGGLELQLKRYGTLEKIKNGNIRKWHILKLPKLSFKLLRISEKFLFNEFSNKRKNSWNVLIIKIGRRLKNFLKKKI